MSKITLSVLMPEDVTRATFFPPAAVRALEALGDVKWNQTGAQYAGAALRDALEGVDICVTGWGTPRLDAAALEKAQALRLMLHTGGAVAPYVSEALYDRGVRVASGNELYAESVAEGTLAYMLAGLRRIPLYDSLTQGGGWKKSDTPNEGLLDQTVGLVGFGAIAQKVVPMLRPLRVKITAYDPFVDDAVFAALGVTRAPTMQEVFATNKVVSVHLPRTKETYHLIDRAMLDRMPDGALLINTARGSVIDEEALADVLLTGRIRAVLDVYEREPLPEGSRLRHIDGVILMPHMGGPTLDRRGLVTLALAEDAGRFLRGEPMTLEISREYGMSMTDDQLKL